MRSRLYKSKTFIYIDSIEGYNPRIGDVVKHDQKTCEITPYGKNMCEFFGLNRDHRGHPVENPNMSTETILGTTCYQSKGIGYVSLDGEATTAGHSSSASGENGIKFTRDNQFILKLFEPKKIMYDAHEKADILREIKRNINEYEAGFYGLIYGQLKCERADIYEGNEGDCVINVGANAKVLKLLSVGTKSTFSKKTKVSMTVTQRPNALVGVYILPFEVGSRKNWLGQEHDPSLKWKTRGFNPNNQNETDDKDVRFIQEALDGAKEHF